MTEYFYVMVRKDMLARYQLCQVAHAAAEASERFHIKEHCHVVMLEAPNIVALVEAAKEISKHGVSLYMQRDQVERDGPIVDTCFATEPLSGTDPRRKLFAKWRLYG